LDFLPSGYLLHETQVSPAPDAEDVSINKYLSITSSSSETMHDRKDSNAGGDEGGDMVCVDRHWRMVGRREDAEHDVMVLFAKHRERQDRWSNMRTTIQTRVNCSS
jgi:hypothetical protein